MKDLILVLIIWMSMMAFAFWRRHVNSKKSKSALPFAVRGLFLQRGRRGENQVVREGDPVVHREEGRQGDPRVHGGAQGGRRYRRERYHESSLADLYDPITMPPALRAAHEANDRVVLAAYGLAPDTPEPEIVAHLFKLYASLTENE